METIDAHRYHKTEVQAPKTTIPKPKKVVWKVPDLVCRKWLYAHDWKKVPGNETKSKSMFLEHRVEFEKTEKDGRLLQALSEVITREECRGGPGQQEGQS
ncbi:hypothetical protein E1B28_011727 [Marasmius oreades]|uniref:Uncharacterized protein n=1 Tax=Marasmius oreades TaxID=181124 RepID=A0A9P7RUP4_9AGAR|nr:uncharacterized protein E1B28_011727 [Marasmius oreades]KAG7090116.1 hypothetical protein E1B28_011727 [Marasmius oreades]